jgi:gamma-glutamyl:cysteine ligase YbdK (ATP-grasp superfamily)
MRGEGYDMERCGSPPQIDSLQDYRDMLASMNTLEPSHPETNIYWDARFRTVEKDGSDIPPEYWRVEYRPMDASPTVRENLGHNAFVLAAVRAMQARDLQLDRDHDQLDRLAEQACHNGLATETEDSTLGKELEGIIEIVEPHMTGQEQRYWQTTDPRTTRIRSQRQIEEGIETHLNHSIRELQDELHS